MINSESPGIKAHFFARRFCRSGTLIIPVANIIHHRRGDSQAWSTAIDSRSILAGVRRFKSGSPHIFPVLSITFPDSVIVPILAINRCMQLWNIDDREQSTGSIEKLS